MKKFWMYFRLDPGNLKRAWLMPKWTCIFVFMLGFQLRAEVYAQHKELIHLSMKEVPLREVFWEIEKQTSFAFMYSADDLDKVGKVDVFVESGELEEVLQQCLKGTGLNYTIQNEMVVLKPARPQTVKEISVKGKVTDDRGNPLPGVTVILKGGTVGVSTGQQGDFVMKLPDKPGIVLQFSYIGMKVKEVEYHGEKSLNVVLKEDITMLEEAVVTTGYQEIKKERMTGATEVVTSADIVNKGYTTLEEALKGTLPGITTMNLSGRPGAQAQIRIRGINSLTGDMDPMWIVDGMPMQGDLPSVSLGATDLQNTVLTSGVGNISPDDIESITILKDAAATAIYGSRAANGVIVVKTKRGRVGQSYINISSTFSIEEAPRNRLEMMNSQEKIAYERGMYEDFPSRRIGGRIPKLLEQLEAGRVSQVEVDTEIDRLSQINTDWFDVIFKVAQNHNHNISMSGGTETTQYYASMNYNRQTGLLPNNAYDRLGASLKLTHDFNKRLRVDFSLNNSIRNDRSSASALSPIQYALYANPYERPYDDDGNYAYDRSYNSELSAIKEGYKYDINILEDCRKNTQRTRYINNQISLQLELQLCQGLMLTGRGTFSNTASHTKMEVAPGTYTSKVQSWLKNAYTEKEISDDQNRGFLKESTSRAQGWTFSYQLAYTKLFAEKHYVSMIAGQELSSNKSNSFSNFFPEYDVEKGLASFPVVDGINAMYLKLDSDPPGSTSEGQNRSVSIFASASYTFMDKYVLSGSFRLDGADIIGKENRFSPLWNVSAKWNMHREGFLADIDFVDILSIRGSYGFTGSIDRNAYPFTIMTYTTRREYEEIQIPSSVNPGNPSIKWQKKEDRSLGLDFSLLGNRINGTVNYYCNDTRDLLDTKRVALSSGRPSIKANVASLRNSGWEFSLKTVLIDYKDFRWTTSFNLSTNKNVVTKTYYRNISEIGNITPGNDYYVEGHSVYGWYGLRFAGVNPMTGTSLAYVTAADAQGNRLGHRLPDGRYIIDVDTEYDDNNVFAEFLGEAYPPITGGFGTVFNYKRISLSAQFSFMANFKLRSFDNGGSFSRTNQNQARKEANRWRKPGDFTDTPGYVSPDGVSSTAYSLYVFDSKIESGNFLKCNNISLGYNLPPKICSRLLVERVRINFNMQNVFTATKYSGADPETMKPDGYPSPRKYMFSLNIGI